MADFTDITLYDDQGIYTGTFPDGVITDITRPPLFYVTLNEEQDTATLALTDIVSGDTIPGQFVLESQTDGSFLYRFEPDPSSPDLAEGTYIYQFVGDPIFVSPSPPFTFTVDRTPPAVTAEVSAITPDSGDPGDGITNATQLTVSGTLTATIDPAFTVRVYRDGTFVGNASVDGTTWTFADPATLVNGQTYAYTARVTDQAGNQGSAGTAYNAVIDTQPPPQTVTIDGISDDSGRSASDFITNDADGLTISASLSAALGAGEKLHYSNNNGVDWTDITANVAGLTVTHVDSSLTSTSTIRFRVSDGANYGTVASQLVTIDTVAPTVDSIALTSALGGENHCLNAGDLVRVTLTMSETVTVTGTPQLALNIGGTTVLADYAEGSGSTALVFTYTILAGQNDANGISIDANSISLNGGTLMDVAGNPAVLTHAAIGDNADYRVDTIAPTAPTGLDLAAADDSGSSDSDDLTKYTTGLSISGTAEAGGTVQLFDDGNDNGLLDSGELLATATAAAFATGIDIALTSQGLHRVRAIATDEAGNSGPASSALDITIDTTAPTAPTGLDLAAADDSGSSDGDNITKYTTDLSISGTAEAGSTVQLFDDGNNNGLLDSGELLATATAAAFATGIDIALASQGLHRVRAIATDEAGNTGPASSSLDITIDTIAPTAPTGLDLAAADDSGSSNSDNITQYTTGLSISGTVETGSTVQLFDDGNNNGLLDSGELLATGTAAAFATGIDIALASQGLHHVRAIATDGAGNTGPASSALDITIDTIAPTAPTGLDLAAADDSGSSDGDNLTKRTTGLSISGTAEAGGTVQLFDDGNNNGLLDSGELLATGTAAAFATGIDIALATDGLHHVRAIATNGAGNASPASSALDLTIDTVAPGVPVFWITVDSGNPIDRITNIDTVFVSHLESGGTWEYAIDNGNWMVGSGSAFTLSEGSHSYATRQFDAAGNAGPASTWVGFTLDTLAPAQTATITSYTDNAGSVQGDFASGTRTDDTSPVLNGTLSTPLDTGNTVQIYEGTTLLGQATMTDSSHWQFALGNLINGSSHSYTAKVMDVAGNVGAAANSFSLTVNTTGPATADSTSLINGTHTMSLGDFKFIEADDNLSAVRINSTAGNDGELRLNGVRVTAGQTVDAADIIAGKLVWVETTAVTTATKTFNINYDVYDTIGLISSTGATLSLTRAAAAGSLSGSGSWFNQTNTSANSWQHVIDAANNGGHIAVLNNSNEWTTAKAVAADNGALIEIGLRQNPNALGTGYGWQWFDGTRINTSVTPWNTVSLDGGGGSGAENQGTIWGDLLNDYVSNRATLSLTEYEQNEFTYNGFTGADTLDFTGVANRSILVNGWGGADTIFGGGGNDTIAVPDIGFTGINGNAGFDILEFTAAGAVNGATLAAKSSNIEEIKLGAGNQQLTLTSTEVNAITSSSNNHTLYVSGTNGDQLGIDVGTTASSWHLTGTSHGLNSYLWYDSSNTATTTRLLVDTDVQVVGHDSKLLTTTTINNFTDNVGAAQGDFGPMVRYLRIYEPSSFDPMGRLSLTGLKVFANGVDIAADKRSTTGADSGSANSIYNSAEALTDENVGVGWNNQIQVNSNLAYADNSGGTNPYIELDLGGLYAVDSLTLWGRSDVPSQSNNLRVYAGAEAFGTATYTALATNAEVKQYDLATVSTNPLNGTSITGMSASVTDDSTPTVNGTLSQTISATDVVKVYDNGVYVGDATVNGTTWSYTPATPLTAVSSHSYTARVADAAGNSGSVSNALALTVLVRGELLVNGPIENNGAGWGINKAGSTLGYEASHFNFDGFGSTYGGSVYQTINVVAGQQYTVQYQIQYNGGGWNSSEFMQATVQNGSVWNAGTQLGGYYGNISGVYQNLSFTFTATSSTATVVFTNVYGQVTAGCDLWLNKASVMLSTDAAATTFTPLVLDLNGNGVQTTDADHGVLFDVGNTGMLGRTAWADAADGLLVRDVNGNGVIDHGGELFGQGTLVANGDQAADGFAALAQFDANQDGKVDTQDAIFQELLVWRDGNSDGISQADELHSLTDLGITSLNLAATQGSTVENGNRHGLVSSYTTADGQDHDLVDVWFQQGAQISLTTNQAGVTSLQLVTSDQSLDLTTMDTTRLQGVDRIDLTGTGSNTLTLSLQDVLALGDQDSSKANNDQNFNQLMIDGDGRDTVLIDGADQWNTTSAGTVSHDGRTYDVFLSSGTSQAQLLIDQATSVTFA